MTNRQAAVRQFVTVSLALFAALFVFGHCTAACATVKVSRAEARGAVLAAAEAVKIGDQTCAKYALEKIDVELARACEDTYTQARGALIIAASGVDAWDEGKKAAVTCAVIRAVDEIVKMAGEMRKRNVRVPPIVDDSIRLASLLGGCPS